MDQSLLEILCCPVTHQPLHVASPEEIARANASLAEALIREDGRILYPIRNSIPLLVPEAGLPLTEAPRHRTV